MENKGDIWILGDHRVFCGDATLPSDMDALIAGEAVHFVFTDPPYNVDYGEGSGFDLPQAARVGMPLPLAVSSASIRGCTRPQSPTAPL